MSIATELEALNTNIKNAYDAIDTKGGTIPQNKNMVNLPTAIDSISSGGSFIGIPREVVDGAYTFPQSSYSFNTPSDAIKILNYGFYYGFYNDPSINSASFSNIEYTEGNYAFASCFEKCTNLSQVSFPSLERIGVQGSVSKGSYCFYNAFNQSSVTSITFPELTYIHSSQAFFYLCNNCANLTSISFPKLKYITHAYGQTPSSTFSPSAVFAYAFNWAINLTSIIFPELLSIERATECFRYAFSSSGLTTASFPKLNNIKASNAFQYAFYGTRLTTLSFPALTSDSFTGFTNQFNNMLYGVNGCTVHFPSSIQSTIGSWSDVTSGFGGTNTTVLFDL